MRGGTGVGGVGLLGSSRCRHGLVLTAAAAVLLLIVPAAATKTPSPAADHGFPVDQYLRGVLAGKVFVAGAPPRILGAKTKDAIFVVGGQARYQAQLALRRAGRDDGTGRFLVLRARSWGSALAHVIQLDPGIVRFFRLAFPRAIGGTRFPPLYAGITYTFEIAPDGPSPRYEHVEVASTPHPDAALRRQGVTLVTLKSGLAPGSYLVRLTAEVGLRPHPLASLYDAYEEVTGAAEWVKVALAPGEVALEKLVDTAIETLVERAAAGEPTALATLRTRALREQVAVKVLNEAVKSALTKTSLVARVAVPTVVPELRGLTRTLAEQRIGERSLRAAFRGPSSTPGSPVRVASQSVAAGTKVKTGTTVVVRLAPLGAQPPPVANRDACMQNWWRGTWKRLEHAGEVTFTQSGATVGSATYTWYGGGSFASMTLSADCRTMKGTAPKTATIAASEFEIHLDGPTYFWGSWRWETTPKDRWNGSFSGRK